MSFQGKVLRWIVEDEMLNTGEAVYCFVDEGFQFRVHTRRLIHGCCELIFPHESRKKFGVVK